MTGWDLVKQRGFRHFFLADVISGFGVGLTTVGANWFMLQQTHANKLVGLYLTLNVLAGFLMSPIAGRLTDRFSRKSVILISFWGRLLPLVGVWGYFKLIGFNLGVMAILAIVTGAGWITYMAASRSYVQTLLPPEALGAANAFIEVSLQVGMFSAGAVSGVILHTMGFTMILAINVAVFLVAIGLLHDVPTATELPTSIVPTATGAWHYVRQRPLILSVGLLSVLPLIVTQLFNVSAPDYVLTILRANSVTYGTADMFYGIGGLTAGLITGWLLTKRSTKSLILLFFSVAALTLLGLFVGRWVSILFVGTFVLGLSNSALRVILGTVLMHQVAPDYMGRTTALWNGLAQFIEIFVATGMGMINDVFGASIGFLLMGLLMLLGILWSWRVL